MFILEGVNNRILVQVRVLRAPVQIGLAEFGPMPANCPRTVRIGIMLRLSICTELHPEPLLCIKGHQFGACEKWHNSLS